MAKFVDYPVGRRTSFVYRYSVVSVLCVALVLAIFRGVINHLLNQTVCIVPINCISATDIIKKWCSYCLFDLDALKEVLTRHYFTTAEMSTYRYLLKYVLHIWFADLL